MTKTSSSTCYSAETSFRIRVVSFALRIEDVHRWRSSGALTTGTRGASCWRRGLHGFVFLANGLLEFAQLALKSSKIERGGWRGSGSSCGEREKVERVRREESREGKKAIERSSWSRYFFALGYV